MGARLLAMVETIRRAKGPFFVARLALRLRFSLDRAEALDDNMVTELVTVSRELGFDPLLADATL